MGYDGGHGRSAYSAYCSGARSPSLAHGNTSIRVTGTGGQVNGWLLAKYLLALGGIALVLLADYVGRRWLGYVGLGLVVSAFLLRFVQRRRTSGR